MYLHAYQSLVWNEMASRRIAEHGLKLLIGDLVFVDTAAPQEIIEDETVADEPNDNSEPANETQEEQKDSDTENLSRFKTMVKPLTEADIASGVYSIFDVVLPLPGHDITYPNNECTQWYVERLAKDELSSEKLKQKHRYWIFWYFNQISLNISKQSL